MKKLSDIYGQDVAKSTLVLLVKGNLIADEDLLEDKIESRKEVCEEHGIPYMQWQSNYRTTRGKEKNVPERELEKQCVELFG